MALQNSSASRVWKFNNLSDYKKGEYLIGSGLVSEAICRNVWNSLQIIECSI